MSMSDPIADMLTRIRNALMAKREVTEVHHCKLKAEIARILKKEGYIADYVVEGGGPKKTLRVYLKYVGEGEAAIAGIKRLSSPGMRRYVRAESKLKSLGGLGIVIVSTSSGVMTDAEARAKKVGGEAVCAVW